MVINGFISDMKARRIKQFNTGFNKWGCRIQKQASPHKTTYLPSMPIFCGGKKKVLRAKQETQNCGTCVPQWTS